MLNMSMFEEKRKVGRPKNGDKLIRRTENELPKVGKLLHIEQGKKDGNRKLQAWEGQIISETQTSYLVRLASGARETFPINDFRFGLLKYEYVG